VNESSELVSLGEAGGHPCSMAEVIVWDAGEEAAAFASLRRRWVAERGRQPGASMPMAFVATDLFGSPAGVDQRRRCVALARWRAAGRVER